jgi:TPR repeat protein
MPSLNLFLALCTKMVKAYRKITKWQKNGITKPLSQGDTDAQYNLGKLYDNDNLSVAHDYVMSHMWFTIAGEKGYQDAFNKRDSVAEKMTPSQIQEAQNLSKEWMAEHQ